MSIRACILILVAAVMLFGACAAPAVSQKPAETPSTGQSSPSNAATQATSSPVTEGQLPAPITTGNSIEICLNSRYSEHSLGGTADSQQMANILWAAGKAPVTGSHRDIYISTPDGEYLYSPATNSLSRHSDKKVSNGALVINCDSELPFDTGVSYILATLASDSLWKSSEPAVASCPKMSSLYFGVQGVTGLTSELVAHSSVPQSDPGWLPDPSTNGQDKVEEVLADLKYTDKFSQDNLTLQQISQLLWAGYGCTPHEIAFGNKKGLTVPSAMAEYFLTGTTYLVNERGVYRYQNRNPSTDLGTRDHRIEPVSSGDVRTDMRTAVDGLPQAPCYVVICLNQKAGSEAVKSWALEEAGFVAGNMLVQASAMGLGCHFRR